MTSTDETTIEKAVHEHLDSQHFGVTDLSKIPFCEVTDAARIIIDNAPTWIVKSQDVRNVLLVMMTNRMIEIIIARAIEYSNFLGGHDFDDRIDKQAFSDLLSMCNKTPELCAMDNVFACISSNRTKYDGDVFRIVVRAIVKMLFQDNDFLRRHVIHCMMCMSDPNGEANVMFSLHLLVTICSNYTQTVFEPYTALYAKLADLLENHIYSCPMVDVIKLIS